MPEVRVYIKETTWAKLLRACSHDKKRAMGKIRQLVEGQYGT